MQAVIDFVQQTTGGVPQDVLDPDASGKAIRAIVNRMNMNTQPVQDNIMTGITRMGWVYGSKAADIYTRQSMLRTLGEDGTEGTEFLLQTVADDEGNFIETNNLRGKKFRAYADVGPQYENLREESVENIKGIGDFLKETPNGQQYLPALLAVLLENMEGVGLQPIKDLNRKNMLLLGLRKPEGDEDKKILAEAQQQAQQPDAQQEFLKSAAEKELAEGRSLDAGSVQKMADAQKKAAETAKIKSEIPQEQAKTLAELRKQAFEQAETLPFGPN